jgi:hypothetical protein
MDKKEIAALKKLAKNGRDLTEIMAKYLKILEDAIGKEAPGTQNQKTAVLKKKAVKPVAVKKASEIKKAPAAKKLPAAKKPAAVVKTALKAKEKPVAKIAVKPVAKAVKPIVKAAKPVVKTTVPKIVAPEKKVVENAKKAVVAEPQKIGKRGRPAKVKI